jgi:hypothetical protein
VRGFFLVVACLWSFRCVAATLALDAFWAGHPPSYDRPLENPIQLEVVVQLTNVGKERITVFCRKEKVPFFESNHSDPAFDGFAIYRVSFLTGLRGIRVIPAISELAPVVLEAGESTEFRCPIRVTPKNTLEKIKLRYLVDEDIGRRFGAWYGDIEAPILRQRMAYPSRK